MIELQIPPNKKSTTTKEQIEQYNKACEKLKNILEKGYPKSSREAFKDEIVRLLNIIANYWKQQGDDKKAQKYFSDVEKIETGEIKTNSPTPLKKYIKSVEKDDNTKEKNESGKVVPLEAYKQEPNSSISVEKHTQQIENNTYSTREVNELGKIVPLEVFFNNDLV